MSKRILAVVVTHNRRVLLSRCLDYLERQVRLPDCIMVINNSSTDDTVEMLSARGIRCITQENVGSAGGWHRGIQSALDEGYDAVWLMDDDGFPAESALDFLEAALVPGVACVSSVVLREEQPTHFVFSYPVLDAAGLPVIFGLPRKLSTLAELTKYASDGTYSFAHFFNGALISTEAVRTIGNVNRDYFIFGDEVDYFFRLRTAGRVISLLRSVHYHPDVSKRPYSASKIYYYVKNSMILNVKYLNAVWLRHVLVVLVVLGRTARRNGLVCALTYLFGMQAPLFYKAIIRGLQGRIAKDMND